MKKVLFFLLLVFLLCFSVQAGSLPVNPVFSKRFSPSELIMAKKAFDIFSDRCRPLMDEYAEDIKSIKISHGFDRQNNICFDYRCDEFKWDKQIYIALEIKNKANKIPVTLRAWGHTEHYYLGGPRNPGITITKFPELCGVKVIDNRESDVYISEPKMSFIK